MQDERLEKKYQPPKRDCKRKAKQYYVCGKTLIGSHSLKRHLFTVHKHQVINTGSEICKIKEQEVFHTNTECSHLKWKANLYKKYNISQEK